MRNSFPLQGRECHRHHSKASTSCINALLEHQSWVGFWMKIGNNSNSSLSVQYIRDVLLVSGKELAFSNDFCQVILCHCNGRSTGTHELPDGLLRNLTIIFLGLNASTPPERDFRCLCIFLIHELSLKKKSTKIIQFTYSAFVVNIVFI